MFKNIFMLGTMFLFLLINKKFSKNEVKYLIEWFIVVFGPFRTMKLLDRLKYVGFNFASDAGISLGFCDLKVPVFIKDILGSGDFLENKLKNKLARSNLSLFEYNMKITNCWNEVSEAIKTNIINGFRESDLTNPLYIMLQSGARGNITQIKQLVGMRGLMVDSQGGIINVPIKSNLKNGLRSLEYFISCYGARKGVIDTAIKTASSGYLTRKLIYTSENMFVKKPNCFTKNCQLVFVFTHNKQAYFKAIDELSGRVLAKDHISNTYSFSEGQDICNFLAKKLIKFRKIYIRSPFTCKLNEGICQLCYGWNLSYGRIVELGENIGVIAAQSISEPATQLTMRTFHTGGIFSGISADIIRASQSGLIYYNNKFDGKILKMKDHERVFLTLGSKRLILVTNSRKRFVLDLPSCSILYVKKGEKVFFNQVIAEISSWGKIKSISNKKHSFKSKVAIDNNTNISGMVNLLDNKLCIVHGNILSSFLIILFLFKKGINQTINIFQQDISCFKFFDYKSIKFKNGYLVSGEFTIRSLVFFGRLNMNLKSSILNNHIIMHINGNKFFLNKRLTLKFVSLNNFFPCHNLFFKESLTANSYLNVYSFQLIESQNGIGNVIAVNQIATSNEEQSLNISRPLINKHDKLFSSIFYQNKVRDIVQGLPAIEAILENKSNVKTRSLMTPQQRLDYIFHLFSRLYSYKIAVRKSVYKIQKYLVNKIKLIYSEQNVRISDKHIEVIVKQMTSKAIVKYSGDSNLIKGELVSLNKLEKINSNIFIKVLYLPLIVGISKLSLLSNSFLASSSFQQTFYTIFVAALEGKSDWLHTLKGNIVVGNLLPVSSAYNIKKNNEGV